jgi:hypothetical protein
VASAEDGKGKSGLLSRWFRGGDAGARSMSRPRLLRAKPLIVEPALVDARLPDGAAAFRAEAKLASAPAPGLSRSSTTIARA